MRFLVNRRRVFFLKLFMMKLNQIQSFEFSDVKFGFNCSFECYFDCVFSRVLNFGSKRVLIDCFNHHVLIAVF